MTNRRSFLKQSGAISAGIAIGQLSGCIRKQSENTEAITWGQRGLSDGQFLTPRAITIDPEDRLYIVDKTGRIQIFDQDGNFIHRWRTPKIKLGKPCGLGLDKNNSLMVGDTHYHRVLFYDINGILDESRTIGGHNGKGPGQFGFVTDVVQDSLGNFYVGDYGEYDRIQKFSPNGEFVMDWGGHGIETGKFLRPQGLLIDSNDHLWIADACNHRIQVFDATDNTARVVDVWGETGTDKGKLRYPYGIEFLPDNQILVCEWGNHRVQRFNRDGSFISSWGNVGTELRQLNQPWGIALDSRQFVHVLDTENNRIQRFHISEMK